MSPYGITRNCMSYDNVKHIYLTENILVSHDMSLQFILKHPINNNEA